MKHFPKVCKVVVLTSSICSLVALYFILKYTNTTPQMDGLHFQGYADYLKGKVVVDLDEV